ncbi:MAG: DUF3939 domain-containing protein [Delftia lacustris]|nr:MULTISPECIES: DUF3939 domain-containing protein [Delftia]
MEVFDGHMRQPTQPDRYHGLYQVDMHYYRSSSWPWPPTWTTSRGAHHGAGFTVCGDNLSDDRGTTLPQYANDNVNSVVGNLSPQLNNLLNASRLGNPAQPCAEYQFLGEFLHSYLDTFSHRDKDNRPFDAISVKLGIGHGFAGSEPDYTYDEDMPILGNMPDPEVPYWDKREYRSLQGEKAVYEFLTAYGTRPALGFEEIRNALERFNAIREEGKEFPKKIDFLQKSVNRFIANGKLNPKGKNDKENKEINFLDKMSEKYDKDQAQINREIFLGDLIGQEEKYPGVCLPGSSVCKEV